MNHGEDRYRANHCSHLAQMSGGRSQHILVVDDDPDIRQILQDRLESYGYLVDTAADGLTALEKLNRLTPHGVFLDIRMPGMDGIEVLRRIKARDCSTVVIIVTAMSDEDAVPSPIGKAAHAYLLKPFDLPKIKHIVEQCFERRTESEPVL
ncbi:MAG: response regulator [Nitrospira sp.]|nr:response regulator [Nitrospira sp.]MCP9454887.1 response regulator [Nitrospira sp.]